jgi:hypothetical protein
VRGAGGVEPAMATKATSSLTQPNEKSTHSSCEDRSPCQTSFLVGVVLRSSSEFFRSETISACAIRFFI